MEERQFGRDLLLLRRFLLSLVENRRRERFPLMCELLLHHIRVREISIRYSAALRRKIMLSCLKPHQLNVSNYRNVFRESTGFPMGLIGRYKSCGAGSLLQYSTRQIGED